MKNKISESKKELGAVVLALGLLFGGLPLLLNYYPSSNAIIIYATGVFLGLFKSIDSLIKKLINEQPIERSMKYEIKVKNYRINQSRDMIPFVLIILSSAAIVYLMLLRPTEISGYLFGGLVGAVLVNFIPFAKALWKFIKGSE